MKVKDLMSTKVTFLTENALLSDIVREMISKDIGIIPICMEDGKLLGVITDRDLVIRMFNHAPSIEQLSAKDIMTTSITTISPTDDIHKAANIFSNAKVHRLPVVENELLIGMLSISDMAKHRIYLSEVGNILHFISISDLMNTRTKK